MKWRAWLVVKWIGAGVVMVGAIGQSADTMAKWWPLIRRLLGDFARSGRMAEVLKLVEAAGMAVMAVCVFRLMSRQEAADALESKAWDERTAKIMKMVDERLKE